MDFAAALSTFLISNVTIVAALSTRSYPAILPQNPALPALVYREMYTEHGHAMQADDTLIRPTYELEVHAASYGAARTAMRVIEGVLQNYMGTMTTCTVQSVLISGGSEGYNPDTKTYTRSKEFEFFIEEV